MGISMKSRKRSIWKIPERHSQLPPRSQCPDSAREPPLVLDALHVLQGPTHRQVHRAVEFRLHEHREGSPAHASSRPPASTHGFRYYRNPRRTMKRAGRSYAPRASNGDLRITLTVWSHLQQVRAQGRCVVGIPRVLDMQPSCFWNTPTVTHFQENFA